MANRKSIKLDDIYKPKIPAMKYDTKFINFYYDINASFRSMVKKDGITYVDKYFKCTDDLLFNKIFNENNQNKVYSECKADYSKLLFLKFCFHAQNTPRGLGATVNFERNIDILISFFSGFDPSSFKSIFDKSYIIKWKDNKPIDPSKAKDCNYPTYLFMALVLTQMLHNRNKNLNSVIYDSVNVCRDKEIIKSKSGVKDINDNEYKEKLVNYCKQVYQFAVFINANKINSLDTFKKVIKFDRSEINNYSYVRTLVEKVQHVDNDAIGPALASDFLKEVSDDFDFVGKPDLHVKRFLDALLKINDFEEDINNPRRLEDDLAYSELLHIIVQKLKSVDSTLTVYKLDRMLFIIGSGKFFLDERQYGKKLLSTILNYAEN